jgi:hypothetical protein
LCRCIYFTQHALSHTHSAMRAPSKNTQNNVDPHITPQRNVVGPPRSGRSLALKCKKQETGPHPNLHQPSGAPPRLARFASIWICCLLRCSRTPYVVRARFAWTSGCDHMSTLPIAVLSALSTQATGASQDWYLPPVKDLWAFKIMSRRCSPLFKTRQRQMTIDIDVMRTRAR